MIIVAVPLAVLFGIVLIKKIPVIGGNIQIALLITGLAALLMGGIYNPVAWLMAWLDGVDRLAWIIFMALFGSIYAQTQVEIGAMDTVLKFLRAMFGRSPKGLVISIMMALTIAGSLLGDAVAAVAVIGILIINSLHEIGLTPVQIAATLVIGSSWGSLMPPVTQALFLSSALLGIEPPDPVTNLGYIAAAVGLVISTVFVCKSFVKMDKLPDDLLPEEKAGQILKKGWKSLIPLLTLAGLIILRLGFAIDPITLVLGSFIDAVKSVTILKGFSNLIVLSMIVVTLISLVYASVRQNIGKVIKEGVISCRSCVGIQLCCGLMLGGFYAGGQLKMIESFALGMDSNLLIIGGSIAMMLVGMLTGSQATAQTSVLTFMGPALVAKGMNPVYVALGGAYMANAGQLAPPVALITFVTCGLVSATLNKDVDVMKTMNACWVMTLTFAVIGLIAFYLA
ncbi:MAG: TRAP transporter large permease subunit [Clostridiales bacterium]